MFFGLGDVYWAVIFFVLGAIIGSFLNVYIYRFHTGKSLAGDSHCLSCQKPLRWYELFPLLSYIFLRGRCAGCGSYIPQRYFLVELFTALGFLTIFLSTHDLFEILLLCVLFCTLVVISVYDVYHMVIPNELVLFTAGIAAVKYGWELYWGASWSLLFPVAGATIGATIFFYGLWFFSKGTWIGFGDVKLSAPLAALTSFPAVFSMIVLSFWVGAVISIVILAYQRIIMWGTKSLHFSGSQLTMKSEVPFAPFLIVGFILAFFFAIDVLQLVSYVL